MELKKIPELEFYNVVLACEAFILDPENEEKAKTFNEMKKNLVVRDRLSAEQKNVVLKKVILDLTQIPNDYYEYGIAIDVFEVIDGLMAYTNINANIDSAWKTPESYDAIIMSGFADYVMDFCEKDYSRLVKTLSDTISFYNIEHVNDLFSNLDGESVDRLTSEFKNFSSDKNAKMLKHLSDVLGYNDDLTQTIKDSIQLKAMAAMGNNSPEDSTPGVQA